MERKVRFLAWFLFSIGSFLFFIDGIKNANMIASVGSLLFLLACIFFMIIEK